MTPDLLNAHFAKAAKPIMDDAAWRLFASSPLMEAIDGRKRPLPEYVEQLKREEAELIARMNQPGGMNGHGE